MDGQNKLGGIKHDDGKPQLGLISKIFLWGIATILTEGRQEYGAHNWRNGLAWHRPYDALQRHLTAWKDGEDKDPKSGKSHLWHAGCELMFLTEYEETHKELDDRYIVKSKQFNDFHAQHQIDNSDLPF